ncbi:MAG: phosphate signaling complex protein PhoU [Acidobacteria bacterium]|nr:phosphate signaling complex protein PhoU [Acidobacteriota bacterium]
MTERHQRHFQGELEQLKTRLLEMGGLAEDRLGDAMRALVDAETRLVEAVITGDAAINALHIEIDDRCFKLLALHQPMAVDLRAIVAAVKINTDLERVGDLAVNIAEAVRRYLRHPPVKELIDIPRMAGIAQGMLRDSLDAFVRRDTTLAQSVLEADDALDALKTQVFRELLTYMLQDPRTIEPALDLILISRHLERIGDHATNIAEDVIFMVSARDVRHAGHELGETD